MEIKKMLELIIDAAKNDDINRVIELAEKQQDKFCDNNCVWTDHHKDCVRAEQKPVVEVRLVAGGKPMFLMCVLPESFKDGDSLYTTPQQPIIDKSAAIRIATALGWTPPKQEQGEPVALEQAPENSLPTWSECDLIIQNDDFRKRAEAGLEGQVLDTPRTTPVPTELHRFIHEYDDADPYRSAWFLHRLECVLKEAATPQQRTWVGLTDEEHTNIQKQTGYNQFMNASEFAVRCQVLVEAKLKEKNSA